MFHCDWWASQTSFREVFKFVDSIHIVADLQHDLLQKLNDASTSLVRSRYLISNTNHPNELNILFASVKNRYHSNRYHSNMSWKLANWCEDPYSLQSLYDVCCWWLVCCRKEPENQQPWQWQGCSEHFDVKQERLPGNTSAKSAYFPAHAFPLWCKISPELGHGWIIHINNEKFAMQLRYR